MIGTAGFVLLLLAGCGGGGDGGQTEQRADTLGKAEFIKEADALCAADERRAKSQYFRTLERRIHPGRETKAEHEAHDIELLKVVLSRALRRQVAEIRALGSPSGGEAEVRAFLNAMEAAIAKAASEPQSMIRLRGAAFAGSDRLAREYGFAVCGRRK